MQNLELYPRRVHVRPHGACLVGAALLGLCLGACEHPFPDSSDRAAPRGCDVQGDSCLEICGTSECTLNSDCEAIAIGYPDLESCESADEAVATVIDAGCNDILPSTSKTSFVACCCTLDP